MVTRLGAGRGDGTVSAPAGLTESAHGITVSLGWTDQADNEDGFRIYRAYEPKGLRQADFSEFASASGLHCWRLGANAPRALC